VNNTLKVIIMKIGALIAVLIEKGIISKEEGKAIIGELGK
jgi:hypothetical protein